MSILGTILSKILGKSPAPTSATAAPSAQAGGTPSAPSSGSTTTAPASSTDVAAVLDDLYAKASEKLDWRHSIVDLMKLLSMESSLGARKELAKELHYDGDTNNSASMNIWLHKQIMTKLAANGGKLPEDLKH